MVCKFYNSNYVKIRPGACAHRPDPHGHSQDINDGQQRQRCVLGLSSDAIVHDKDLGIFCIKLDNFGQQMCKQPYANGQLGLCDACSASRDVTWCMRRQLHAEFRKLPFTHATINPRV